MSRSIHKLALIFSIAISSAAAAAPPRAPDIDLNGDGTVDRREFVKGRDARFTQLDRNRDSTVSRADFPDLTSTTMIAKLGRVIGMADLNKDGKVTRNEVGMAGTPLFDATDADGNGLIDGAELTNLRSLINSPL